ncbi:MAG: hypothetical protein ACTTJS_06390 [Wolinella sp.]
MKNIVLCVLLAASLAYADNYIQVPKPTPKLSPLDAKLKQLSSQYSPNTAYYIDARTGNVVPVSKANSRIQMTSKKGMPKMEKTPAPKIPFEIKEERIELLR